MNKRSLILRWTLVLILVFIWPLAPAFNQTSPANKPISYEAYDGWRAIQGTQVSRDGTWLAYALVPQDGDGELVVRNLKTDKEYRAARGSAPVLTVDGKFVVFTIAPVKADVDKAKKEKRKAWDVLSPYLKKYIDADEETRVLLLLFPRDLANELLKKEELEYDEIDAIFKEYKKSKFTPVPFLAT